MDAFKIATWNVNSLRVRLPHVLQWLKEAKPDVLALQEIKMETAHFPFEVFEEAGFHAHVSGQKTYNGVAFLSRTPGTEVVTDIPGFHDSQRRIIGMTWQGLRIVNVYIPNGESIHSEKYAYKLRWLEAFHAYLSDELKQHARVMILGDFNIAPDERDVYNPVLCEGHVLFSDKEREAFHAFIQMGFVDCFRLFSQPDKAFTWWDYRLNAFRRNMGLRIDHILASSILAKHVTTCVIDSHPRSWERPSDHAPVFASITRTA